jgi:hypothetical protein
LSRRAVSLDSFGQEYDMTKLIAALIASAFALGAYAQNAATPAAPATPAAAATSEAKAAEPTKKAAPAKKHHRHHHAKKAAKKSAA